MASKGLQKFHSDRVRGSVYSICAGSDMQLTVEFQSNFGAWSALHWQTGQLQSKFQADQLILPRLRIFTGMVIAGWEQVN